MPLVYRYLFSGLWLSWILYWLWAARHAKPNARLETVGSRLLHAVPLLVAVALLWVDRVPVAFLGARIFPATLWPFWIGALLTTLGMLFSVWARVHLGRNWSAVVTVKENHELIDTGPYALVRHPIYTGLLAAIVGSAVARDDWRGVLAVVIAWLALWGKSRLEERWMTGQFGERYVAYAQRVPALLPFTNWRV